MSIFKKLFAGPISHNRTVVSEVKFIREEKGQDAFLGIEPAVKKIYSAPNKAEAITFLRNSPIEKRMFFIEIDTPEGRVGKDINGLYDERGNLDQDDSSVSPKHGVTIIFGSSVPLQKLKDQAITLSKTTTGTIFCSATFDAAMATCNNAGNSILRYRTLSPCTICYFFSVPRSAYLNSILTADNLNLWMKQYFSRSLIEQLNARNFTREELPKTSIEACQEDSSVAIISTWNSVRGDICKKYALALEAAYSEVA